MKKIPCVFVRKHIDLKTGEPFDERKKGTKYLAIDQVNPGCEWVLNGEGTPTIKWDGTPVLAVFNELDQRDWFQRYQGNNPPDGSRVADVRQDNGKTIYWVPVTDQWIKLAIANTVGNDTHDTISYEPMATYEAVGPRINGNRHKLTEHELIIHGGGDIDDLVPRDFNGLKGYLETFNCPITPMYEPLYYHEGIVFHHPDGRMAKIKRSDFNFE